jgi:hypothetical protein
LLTANETFLGPSLESHPTTAAESRRISERLSGCPKEFGFRRTCSEALRIPAIDGISKKPTMLIARGQNRNTRRNRKINFGCAIVMLQDGIEAALQKTFGRLAGKASTLRSAAAGWLA